MGKVDYSGQENNKQDLLIQLISRTVGDIENRQIHVTAQKLDLRQLDHFKVEIIVSGLSTELFGMIGFRNHLYTVKKMAKELGGDVILKVSNLESGISLIATFLTQDPMNFSETSLSHLNFIH